MELVREMTAPAPREGELAWLWAEGGPGEHWDSTPPAWWWEGLAGGSQENCPGAGVNGGCTSTVDHQNQGWLDESCRVFLTTADGRGVRTWEVEVQQFLGEADAPPEMHGGPGGVGGYVYVTQPDGVQKWCLITGQEAPGDSGWWDGRVIWQEERGHGGLTLSCLHEGGREYGLELDEPGRRRRWLLQAEAHWDYFPAVAQSEPAGARLGGYVYVMEPGSAPRWAYLHGVQAAGHNGKAAALSPAGNASALEKLVQGLLALGTSM